MIDDLYRNAFKEVYEILQNSENELVEKIPQNFINFLKNNMNNDYQTNIDTSISLENQHLLQETEDILSLIFRSYIATEEEKLEIIEKDKQELTKIEEAKKAQYKDIDEIFQKREKLNNITIDNNLMVIPNENFIKRLFKKILSIFRR